MAALLTATLAPPAGAAPAAPPTPRAAAATGTGWRAPVTPVRVVRGFDPPTGPYGAGHRGVDLVTAPGEAVAAAAAGTVTFAGPVAGRGVVVVSHPGGIVTEYEPLRPAVVRGETVDAGALLGRVTGRHGACAPGRCLHWGARRDGVYLDPLGLLAPLGPVRLLPWP